MTKRTDGSGSERQIWSTDAHFHVDDWARDGRSVLIHLSRGSRYEPVEILVEPEVSVRPYRVTKFSEFGAVISPDDRRIAFVSDASGQPEVYLTRRDGTGTVQVSSGGGREPLWSRDGRELFFRSTTHLMSVDVPPGGTLTLGEPRVLFEARFEAGGRGPGYAVSPDGQRFLFLQSVPSATAGNEVVVTINWLEDLKRLVPITRP